MRHVGDDLERVAVAADAVVEEFRLHARLLMKFFGVPPPRTTDAVRDGG